MKKKFLRNVALCTSMFFAMSTMSAFRIGNSPTATKLALALSSSTQTITGDAVTTPRNETLYLAGMFWSKPNDFNPLSSNSNLNYITQSAYSSGLLYETLFMYNTMNNKLYPLLANSYKWNTGRTQITVTLNPNAKWSDGKAVTAYDVAYTFTSHKKYNTVQGVYFEPYIERIDAKDSHTCVIVAKKNAKGQAVNPLLLEEYLPRVYVMQKSYLQKVEKRCGNNPEKIKTDRMEDMVSSAPYKVYYSSDQKLVLKRNDNCWGKSASRWGKLPTPKYIENIAYKDNSAITVALKAGEIDIADVFIPNIQNLWEKEGLPISTYIDKAPYNIAASMPALFFNTKRKGLDNVNVRKAIAMAINYDEILSNAMTGQAPSFRSIPRSIMNPLSGEQALVDNNALKDLQFQGNDIAGAKKLLDNAGIVDKDGDGYRELDGKKLSYKVQCPNGWSDWSAACEIVAAAGKKIGIEIQTYYPTKTVHVNDYATGNFDMAMAYTPGTAISCPWARAVAILSNRYNDLKLNMLGNYGYYSNPKAESIINEIPYVSDKAKLKQMYTELSKIYLQDVPSVSLMYRPNCWCVVNESVWTGYPTEGDNTQIPPDLCIYGYSIAALYNLKLVK
jgi:peptide/nickel transport system substrate-binding protein